MITVSRDASFDECVDAMEANQVRRLIVVDDQDHVVGIISQADIALHGRKKKTGDLLQEISKPDEAS